MSEIKKHTTTIKGSSDRDILIDYRYREDFTPKPIIIFAHGYKGYKDWGAWNLVADRFAQKGFVFVKFNFSHNGGTPDNPIDFPDLDAFGRNTYSKEVHDLHQVIEWVKKHDWNGQANTNAVGLIGHSRGGGVAIIAAAQSNSIKAITTWASVRDFEERFPEGEELNKWKADGVRYVKNGRTGQDMPHDIEFYEDFQQNAEELKIQSAVQKLSIPLFIVHGSDDEAVGVENANSLFQWSETALLEVIEGAGHTFGTKQPWTESVIPDHMETLVEDTISFYTGAFSEG